MVSPKRWPVNMGLILEQLALRASAALTGENPKKGGPAIDALLKGLVKHYDVDVGYLRANDHDIHATVLIGEWPRRMQVPVPDPIGVIYFATADPVFAAMETLQGVFITRPTDEEYLKTIESGSGVPRVSSVGLPLFSPDGVTIGTLGFVKYGDRAWGPEEIEGLEAIADWFAQFDIRNVGPVDERHAG